MFKILFLKLSLLSALVANANDLDKMKTYNEIQRLINVQGDKNTALDLAKKLRSQMSKEDKLYSEIDSLIIYLKDGNPNYPLEKAIQFATGTKDEIYCKGVGLVYLIANHNDGTTSELKLISSSRKFINDYSIVKTGDWVYELDTGYRDPVKSDSWLESSTESSFKFSELRKRTKNEVDKGTWQASWAAKDKKYNYHTSGDTPEPLPIYMANDFHLWGSYDLGFKIKFKVGSKDQLSGFESGAPKDIILKTNREVTEKLAHFEYKDAAGVSYKHADCFKVKNDIQLDKLEDLKPNKK